MHRIGKNAVFLIDGSSFLFRAYYGLRPLHTSKGLPVQATYGFCRMIKKLIDDFNPQSMVLVWDSKGKTFRSEIYEDYKATRQAPPSDLSQQKEQIVEIAEAMGLYQLAKPGYEADDLIASIVAHNPDQQCVIVSSDKDLQQLLAKNVLVYDAFKREVIDEQGFRAEREFGPEGLLMYHALLGDASDNIPGVKGVGKKGAQDLVKQFGTLENLYQNLDQVTKVRMREILAEQKEKAFLSKDLFTLKIIDLDCGMADFAYDAFGWNKAYHLFEALEFKSFLKDIDILPGVQKDIFGGLGGPGPRSRELEVPPQDAPLDNWTRVIVNEKQILEELVKNIAHKGECAFDTETAGLQPLEHALVGISLAFDDTSGYYIPVGHPEGEVKQLDKEFVIRTLRPLFEDINIKKYAHCAKFDQLVLYAAGIDDIEIAFDTLLAANVIRKSWQKIGLKTLSQFYLGEPMQTFKQVVGKKYKTFAQVPLNEGASYAAHDALQTYKLKAFFEKELEKPENSTLKKIFLEIDMPFSEVLFDLEKMGILVDPEVLRSTGAKIQHEIDGVEAKIFALIEAHRGDDVRPAINLNSPQQLEALLFDEFGLPSVKLSKEGRRSTDQEVLEQLTSSHPVPGLILEYRGLYKLKSTYIEPLLECINSRTGRIHTSYNQTDVSTGRLSSNNPNMQNIPAGKGHGIAIRSAFIAPAGRLLLSADYSQIELRVLAHITGDAALKEAFLAGRDIHRETASEIFGINPGEVTAEQRGVGKRINFSIMYGLTPFGLAHDLGIKPGEAKGYIDAYFNKYAGVRSWIDQTIERAKIDGYVETLYGRRRHIPELLEKNKTLYEQGRRMAMNSPIQGTQSDIMKIAMIKLGSAFKKQSLDAAMLLQIHDEVIVECSELQREQVESTIKTCLEGAVKLDVPLLVEVRSGRNWGEITK